MNERTITNHGTTRWRIAAKVAVALLLLGGALLGMTQLFILLVVFGLLIAPV